MHDVSKRHKPIFYGKDHIHPFTGGVAVLRIFSRLGFLQKDLHLHLGQNARLDKLKLESVIGLIMDSTHDPVESVDPHYAERFKDVPYCTEVHSHKNLD